jgi:hypothetical protein
VAAIRKRGSGPNAVNTYEVRRNTHDGGEKDNNNYFYKAVLMLQLSNIKGNHLYRA